MAIGGYRVGSGRSKTGYYKGIYCGSTYELCWVIHAIDHGIEFTRFPGYVEANGKKYYPDFLLGDGKTIVETKGYEKIEAVDIKTKIAEFYGYTVNVLRKDDLKFAFEYVSNTYKTNKFYELYDGYKPKYQKLCLGCNSLFFSNNKKAKCCSRICAGKMPKDESSRKKMGDGGAKNKGKSFTRDKKYKWITNASINTRILITEEIPHGFISGYTRINKFGDIG